MGKDLMLSEALKIIQGAFFFDSVDELGNGSALATGGCWILARMRVKD